jgi:hypothetical protein
MSGDRAMSTASTPGILDGSSLPSSFSASTDSPASQTQQNLDEPGDAGDDGCLPTCLDDRFHETGLDEASIHGTGIMLVDSSFEKS